jgi:POT family proton-dependent oligopeptide transporter
LPPTGDKYMAAEKVNIDLRAILDETKVADGAQLFQLAKMNLAKVDEAKSKEFNVDIEAKLKNINKLKGEREIAVKDKKEFVNTFKAQDTTFTESEFKVIQEKKVITVTYPSFAGFTIRTLYDFFMVFVVLCGIASVILFSLTPVIKKMMHGVR